MIVDLYGFERRLASWSFRIDDLAARSLKADIRCRFDAVLHVDELKALLAIAESAFVALGRAGRAEKEHLQEEMESACREIEAVIGQPVRWTFAVLPQARPAEALTFIPRRPTTMTNPDRGDSPSAHSRR